MSYQVLARRLRPTRFDELVGQDHVVRALVHGLESGRVHHAYLFTGTRGVGKTTIARILARCLNCEQGVGPEPCGTCSSCVEIDEGRHVDLLEVDAASRTKVDDTRELLDNVQYRPTRGRFKIYLIDEVHMLSASSFNALLKTLEEPPEHVKFLLATTDPRKIPLTVLSRCLQLQLKNLLPETIAGYLEEVLTAEGVEFEAAALAEIARAGRGSMRDALSITDQAIAFGGGAIRAGDLAAMLGGAEHAEFERLVEALLAEDAEATLAVCAELAARSVDFSELLASLASLLHDAAIAQVVGGRGMDETSLAQRLAEALSPEAVQLYYQIVLLGQRDLHLAPDPRCGFEMTMLRLLAFEPLPPEPPPDRDEVPSRDTPEEPPARRRRSSEQRVANETASTTGRGPASAARAEAFEETASPGVADVASESADVPWDARVETLGLAGVARMIVEHSVGRPTADDHWELVLDPNHDTLLNDSQVASIQRALSDRLGHDVRVSVKVDEPGEETPAARRERIARELKQQAIESLAADRTVRALVTEFDAELDLDSVRHRE